MLTHVVCFKYKEGTPEAVRADHRARLATLRGIEGVTDLKVGRDIVGSKRSYDTGLIVTLPDRAALDAYQTDPAHVPIAQLGVSLCDNIVAVDFE
jgi:hypothetical protein